MDWLNDLKFLVDVGVGKKPKGGITMTRVQELEHVVASLPKEEYMQFRHWFLDRDWSEWDRQIEEDIEAGKLNFLVKEALEAKKNHKLKDL